MFRQTLITLSLLGLALSASAQDSLLNREFSFVADQDAWLTGQNAAALTRFSSRNISMAEIYGLTSHGHFTDYSGSPHAAQAGAEVQSLYRLSRRTVAYGRMSYNNFTGRQMNGSVFLDHDRLPFNIVEDSTNTLGRKHSDIYQLTGAVGVDVWRGLSLGVRADYKAANYAKYKDPRHKNKLMDLDVSVGFLMPLGSHLSLGAHYFYHRTTETLQFSTYGKTDRTYITLVDYGAFMGTTEAFGSSFTDRNRELPLVSDYNGFGVQAEWRVTPRLSWQHAFTMDYRDGYYGDRSPYSVLYAQFSSHTYTYHTRLQLRTATSLHHLDLDLNAENLVNRMSHYRSTVNEQGATYYQYFSPERSANKVWATTRASYTGWLGITGDMARWRVEASAAFGHRRQTAYLYPYFRRQHLDNTELGLTLERNFGLGRGIMGVRGSYSFLYGHGLPATDGAMVQPSDKQSFPATMPAWLMREYRWLTSPQYRAGAGVRYSFVFPHTHLKTYADLSCQTHKANGIAGQDYVDGRDNTAVRLSFGCTF